MDAHHQPIALPPGFRNPAQVIGQVGGVSPAFNSSAITRNEAGVEKINFLPVVRRSLFVAEEMLAVTCIFLLETQFASQAAQHC